MSTPPAGSPGSNPYPYGQPAPSRSTYGPPPYPPQPQHPYPQSAYPPGAYQPGAYAPAAAVTLPPILVSTMNDVPGYAITAVYGQVHGAALRYRAFLPTPGRIRGPGSPEEAHYLRVLADARAAAVGRLCEAAIARGANAVIAVRLTSTDVDASVSEVVAYGTAVLVTKPEPTARTASGDQPSL